ncbi:hypothetical protein CLIB1423_03S01530 [[Candida] railenensis]|uniref:Uncharacterized protein n=1 Tax=[Candida] railenensis TaxID=45579 RepID=A0A9P0QM28_9ASCO|nr:hypothetical protein CLIB1423_03S01530 [[Candida] railenensis]
MDYFDKFEEVSVCTFTYKFPVKKKKLQKCSIQELLTEDSYPFTFNRPMDSLNRKFKFVHYDPTPPSVEDTIDAEKLLSNSYRTRNSFIRARSIMSLLIKEIEGDTKISTISKMVSKIWRTGCKYIQYYFQYVSSLDAEYRLMKHWKYSHGSAEYYSFINCFQSYKKDVQNLQKIPLASKFEIRKERYKVCKKRVASRENENVTLRISSVLGILAEDVFLTQEAPKR